MALLSQAQDINTREVIWVAQNVAQGRRQLNSHTSDCYARDGIDGFPAYEFAGLYTDYTGNGWESKIVAFQKKWAEAVVEQEV
jgi:hypothetical protein